MFVRHLWTCSGTPDDQANVNGPTAATSSSDYGRVSTMRQVEACVDGIRAVGEPFLGEGMTGAEIAGLDTAIAGVLQTLVADGSISNYQHQDGLFRAK